MEVLGELKELLAGAVAAAGYQLWGAERIQMGKTFTLRIYIDTEKGVTIDDCEKASRQISAVLEVEQPSLSKYNLEVSSPGLFRPLFCIEHYQQFVGVPIKLRLKQATEDNRKNFSGLLTKVVDETIILTIDGEEYKFDLDAIAQAHLDPKI